MRTTKTQDKRTCNKTGWRQVVAGLALLIFSTGINAQVTIGDGIPPQDFSVLEIVSNGSAGLRMPYLTTQERDDMTATQEFDNLKTTLAKGLTIYNTTIDCLEFWNGEKWISTCDGDMPPYIPVTPDATATVAACAVSSAKASVGDNTGFYMFTYQTMNMYANYSGGTPASYQWVVDGKLVAGANGATYAYRPPADIALVNMIFGATAHRITIQPGLYLRIILALQAGRFPARNNGLLSTKVVRPSAHPVLPLPAVLGQHKENSQRIASVVIKLLTLSFCPPPTAAATPAILR